MSLTAIQSRQFGSVLNTMWDGTELKDKHTATRSLIIQIYKEQIAKPDLLRQEVLQAVVATKIGALDADSLEKIQDIVATAFQSANTIREYRLEMTGKGEWFLTAKAAQKELEDNEKTFLKDSLVGLMPESVQGEMKKYFEVTFANHRNNLIWGTLAQTLRNHIDDMFKTGSYEKNALIEMINTFKGYFDGLLPGEEAAQPTTPDAAATPTATPEVAPKNVFEELKEVMINDFRETIIASAPENKQELIRKRIENPNDDVQGGGRTSNEVIWRFEIALNDAKNFNELQSKYQSLLDEYCYNNPTWCELRTPASDKGMATMKHIIDSYQF